MALIPKDAYPGQVDTSDPAYPQGKARNVTTAGDGTGTPFEAELVNDIWGMQQAVLDQGGVTPDGIPDEVGASQYVEALQAIGDQRIAAEFYAPGAERIVGDEWVYPAEKLRTRYLSGVELSQLLSGSSSGDGHNEWRFPFPPVYPDDTGGIRSLYDAARLVIPLTALFPYGAVVNRIRALVKPGVARTAKSSSPGDNGRMWMGLYTQTISMSSKAAFLSATPFSGHIEDDGTTDKQVLDSTAGNGGSAIDIPLPSNLGHNDSATAYLLVLTAGSDFLSSGAGTHTEDLLDGLILNWTDAGPRNP